MMTWWAREAHKCPLEAVAGGLARPTTNSRSPKAKHVRRKCAPSALGVGRNPSPGRFLAPDRSALGSGLGVDSFSAQARKFAILNAECRSEIASKAGPRRALFRGISRLKDRSETGGGSTRTADLGIIQNRVDYALELLSRSERGFHCPSGVPDPANLRVGWHGCKRVSKHHGSRSQILHQDLWR